MDWQIIIGLITLALVIFGIIWGNGLWTRREIIEVIHPKMSVELKTDKKNGVHFVCIFHLNYVQGIREQYVSKIFIKFDESSWKKAQRFFEIPTTICKGIEAGARVRLPIGQPMQFVHDDFFPMRGEITEKKGEELDNFIQELCHRYKIGWEDTYRKTRWKTINQLEDMKKSFKGAM